MVLDCGDNSNVSPSQPHYLSCRSTSICHCTVQIPLGTSENEDIPDGPCLVCHRRSSSNRLDENCPSDFSYMFAVASRSTHGVQRTMCCSRERFKAQRGCVRQHHLGQIGREGHQGGCAGDDAGANGKEWDACSQAKSGGDGKRIRSWKSAPQQVLIAVIVVWTSKLIASVAIVPPNAKYLTSE